MRSREKASQGHHKEGGCKWEKCDQTRHQHVSCCWEEQNSTPRRALLYNCLGGQSRNTHLLSWLTRVLTPAAAGVVSAFAARGVCRLQVSVSCTVLPCCHKRGPGKVPCTMCYSRQVSHRCAASAAAQELLTRLFLPSACVKKGFASVLCQAEKWNYSTPSEDFYDKRIPLTTLSVRAQKHLSFIIFPSLKSYFMGCQERNGYWGKSTLFPVSFRLCVGPCTLAWWWLGNMTIYPHCIWEKQLTWYPIQEHTIFFNSIPGAVFLLPDLGITRIIAAMAVM